MFQVPAKMSIVLQIFWIAHLESWILQWYAFVSNIDVIMILSLFEPERSVFVFLA